MTAKDIIAGKQALEILDQLTKELGITNVKCFGFVKGKWVVRYFKGKQNKFDSFDSMYEFLTNEGND
jgi:hypothetical protein